LRSRMFGEGLPAPLGYARVRAKRTLGARTRAARRDARRTFRSHRPSICPALDCAGRASRIGLSSCSPVHGGLLHERLHQPFRLCNFRHFRRRRETFERRREDTTRASRGRSRIGRPRRTQARRAQSPRARVLIMSDALVGWVRGPQPPIDLGSGSAQIARFALDERPCPIRGWRPW